MSNLDEIGGVVAGCEDRYRIERLGKAALNMACDSLRMSSSGINVVLCGEPLDKRETAAEFMNSIYQSGGHSDRRKAFSESFEDTDRLPYSTLFRVISSGNKRTVLMNLSHYLDTMP